MTSIQFGAPWDVPEQALPTHATGEEPERGPIKTAGDYRKLKGRIWRVRGS